MNHSSENNCPCGTDHGPATHHPGSTERCTAFNPLAEIRTLSQFESWLDRELIALELQFEDFETTNSKRRYFAR